MNLPPNRKTGKIENPATDPGSYKFTMRTKRKRNERKTNKRFTRTIRKTHDTRNECMLHETNARYTNERIIGAYM